MKFQTFDLENEVKDIYDLAKNDGPMSLVDLKCMEKIMFLSSALLEQFGKEYNFHRLMLKIEGQGYQQFCFLLMFNRIKPLVYLQKHAKLRPSPAIMEQLPTVKCLTLSLKLCC